MTDWLSKQPAPGNFVLREEEGIARDVVVLKATESKIPAGTLLGRITATGKYAPYNPDANDGTQTPTCILYAPYNGTNIDADVLVISRLSEVIEAQLFGIQPAHRDDVVAALESRNIVLR